MKGRLLAIGIIVSSLTGCATTEQGVLYPKWLADHYNSMDPCQSSNWRENGGHMDMSRYHRSELTGYPSFCGANDNTVTVTSRTTKTHSGYKTVTRIRRN